LDQQARLETPVRRLRLRMRAVSAGGHHRALRVDERLLAAVQLPPRTALTAKRLRTRHGAGGAAFGPRHQQRVFRWNCHDCYLRKELAALLVKPFHPKPASTLSSAGHRRGLISEPEIFLRCPRPPAIRTDLK